ncbi:MAG TPA: polyprenyl synthetase family protein [Candidatus Limnocylindrales bacterium]|nr:polyprenyl synthetase family protein [Candidatus Limnocylindrales bacterium]
MACKKTRTLYSGDFQSYCDGVKSLVDSELQTLLPVVAELNLRKQIEYALYTEGKRLRPTLVLLSGESVGAKKEQLRKLALAIELLHLATLVHDDILDEDTFRRNSVSVYAKWGVKEAILVGDMLASLSLSLCKGYKRKILDVMIDTCKQLSDGEYADVTLASTALNEEDYFRKVRKKCASLFQAACECGAVAANGSPSETNALRVYGENYGVAYQIRDDMIDVENSGSDLQADLSRFRVPLPIINAYNNASDEKQVLLERLLSAKTQESLSAFLNEAQVYFKNGSLGYCARKIDEHIDRAVASLAPLEESTFKSHLAEMAELLRIKESEIVV